MADLDTFEFNALTMDEISNEIGEKNIDAMLDDTILWDTDFGDTLKAFDDILYPDTSKIVNNGDDSIDENDLKEKEEFENFADLLMELEKEGEDLDPIIIGSEVDNSSSLFLENGGLDPIVLGTRVDKPYLPFNTSINVPPRFEESVCYNFPLDMRILEEPVHDIKNQSKNSQSTSPLNRIYPRHVSESSDAPSSIPLHHRNTSNAYFLANSSVPTPFMDVLHQQRPFNGTPHIVPLSAVRKEKKKKPVQSKTNEKYQDMSKMTDEEAANNCNYANMRGRTQEPFPVKLHSIVERSEEEGFSTIISWAPHGRAFKIHKEALFVEKVLPLYFFQSKMSSFARQLKMYGFHKIKNKYNADKGAYFHELFLRGRPGLACGIARLNCAASRKYEPIMHEFPPMPCSKPCDQSKSSPSKDETAKEKNSNNLRVIRYVSFSSAENPITSNASQIAIDVNDKDREENSLKPNIRTKLYFDSAKESVIEDSQNAGLQSCEHVCVPKVKNIDESGKSIMQASPALEKKVSPLPDLGELLSPQQHTLTSL